METAAPTDHSTPLVREYMTSEVATVAPEETVAAVADRIAATGHDGFPVCDARRVEGFVTARDLLLAADGAPVESVMSRDLVVAHPEMAVTDAARVILRSGIQKLPVVDDDGTLVGIISNADVIRSQIERATPEKVGKLIRTLESIHDVAATREHREVSLTALTPTQDEVYADELEGRTYELEHGLAEPLVVIDTPDGLFLADGHHRVLAARRRGIGTMDAYVIAIEDPIDLGMARTAERQGLESLEDVRVVDYGRHPLVETTERFQ
ncbi:MAG: CBS domain-containing ParB/RepB/Spo0J family partition protein [Halobacteriales archaeon]